MREMPKHVQAQISLFNERLKHTDFCTDLISLCHPENPCAAWELDRDLLDLCGCTQLSDSQYKRNPRQDALVQGHALEKQCHGNNSVLNVDNSKISMPFRRHAGQCSSSEGQWLH